MEAVDGIIATVVLLALIAVYAGFVEIMRQVTLWLSKTHDDDEQGR
jgi:hypothetical protein